MKAALSRAYAVAVEVEAETPAARVDAQADLQWLQRQLWGQPTALSWTAILIRALLPARMFDMSNLSMQRTNFIALAEIAYSLATPLCFTSGTGV
jgi:hypothetical protein